MTLEIINTINVLGHLRVDVPTLAETQITFYGTLGYVAFIILCIFAITGAILLLKRLHITKQK